MNIQETVNNYILTKFLHGDSQSLTPNTFLFERGIIDSIGMLLLVQFLEKTFSIHVEDQEYIPDYFSTIERISIFVQNKLAQKTI